MIVESPAKSKTIKKILGDGFQIEASFGHVRNLPDNVLGFDVHDGFKPTYVVIPDKKKVAGLLSNICFLLLVWKFLSTQHTLQIKQSKLK